MNASGYSGIDGFLGTRAPFMIDVVCVAMFAVVVVLAWSIYQVKVRRRYWIHTWTQITLGIVLLVIVVLFELDIRLHGWEERAADRIGGHVASDVFWALYIRVVRALASVA